MLRRTLAAALALTAASAGAQRVPGRDLLTHPLGLAAEAPAFGSGAAGGMWNPATSLLGPGERGRLAGAALTAPIDLSLTGQVLHGAARIRSGTLAIVIARAAITNLAHTETDPQSVGPDIPYSTWIVSAGWAQRVHPHIIAGAALRWHTGHVYTEQASAVVTDAGVVVDGLSSRDVRVAFSTFLFGPGTNSSATLSAAADGRIIGSDTLYALRGGFSISHTKGSATERFPYIEARIAKVSVRGGPVQIDAFGSTSWRLRAGLLLRHAGYTIGVTREDNAGGLAPTYQLGVANVFR